MYAVITGQLTNELRIKSMNILHIILAIANGELTNEPQYPLSKIANIECLL